MKLISKNIIVAFLILMLLAGAYLVLQDNLRSQDELSLSELVKKINSGKVGGIVVRGDELEITLKSDAVFLANKEAESSLSETVANYSVSKEALGQVSVEVK